MSGQKIIDGLQEALSDREDEYGEIAVKCVLADGRWRVLDWPAYRATADMMVKSRRLQAMESMGRTLYRLNPTERG